MGEKLSERLEHIGRHEDDFGVVDVTAKTLRALRRDAESLEQRIAELDRHAERARERIGILESQLETERAISNSRLAEIGGLNQRIAELEAASRAVDVLHSSGFENRCTECGQAFPCRTHRVLADINEQIGGRDDVA